MRGQLFPTTVYLDEDIRRQVARLAVATGKPKAVIVREVLAAGLKTYEVPVHRGCHPELCVKISRKQGDKEARARQRV
jgi:hypothetical protein